MTKTVVGLFDEFDEARAAVRDLVAAGFRREDIGITGNDAHGELGKEAGGHETEGVARHTGAASGVGIGAALGGLGGVLLGIGALTLPGIGPVLAAGPLATALLGAGVGAVAGGLIGALADLGIPEEEAHYYAEGVRRGGSLVTVIADDRSSRTAAEILQAHGAVDINQRVAGWRERGWHGYNPDAAPYTPAEVTAERTAREAARESSPGGIPAGMNAAAAAPNPMTLPPISGPLPAQPPMAAAPTAPAPTAPAPTAPFTPGAPAEPAMRSAPAAGTPIAHGATYAGTVFPGVRIYDRTQQTPQAAIAGAAPSTTTERGTFDRDFRSDFSQRYGTSGDRYEEYEPAYRYGTERAGASGDDDWAAAEPQIRQEWEARNTGAWDRVRDAVRYGWERARARTLDRAA